MQTQENKEQKRTDEVNALVLLEIEQVTMHRLVKQQKALFTSGTCKIAKLDHGQADSVYFINLNSFYYTIHKDVVFIKIEYDDTVSYLFPHFDNGMSSITIIKDNATILNLDEVLSNAAVLSTYETAMMDPNIRNKIEEHCVNINTKPIFYPDSVKKVISSTGKILNSAFAALGGLLKTGVEKTGNFINNKIDDHNEPTHIKPETREKWEKLKKGTNQFVQVSSEFVTSILNPVIQKGKEYSKEVTDKINNSQNQKVKYAKELAEVSGKAITDAFDGFIKGGTEVTKELGEQGKKIITKKYGDQVVRTITGQNGEPSSRPISLSQQPQRENTEGARMIQKTQKRENATDTKERQSQRENQRLLSVKQTQEIKYPGFKDNERLNQ